jgi:hypothetical protein
VKISFVDEIATAARLGYCTNQFKSLGVAAMLKTTNEEGNWFRVGRKHLTTKLRTESQSQ